MADNPTRPPRPRPGESAPPVVLRSKRPSVPELWAEITESHTVESDPPGVRWLDRRVGRFVRLAVRWVIRTKGGTALVALVSAFLTWLSHHLFHWMGP